MSAAVLAVLQFTASLSYLPNTFSDERLGFGCNTPRLGGVEPDRPRIVQRRFKGLRTQAYDQVSVDVQSFYALLRTAHCHEQRSRSGVQE